MAFITYNQLMDFLYPLQNKLPIATLLAMDNIISKVNINALLLQTVLY